ncbi:MAG: murein DD-endopeptidase MepM/ murein hydrolase activator NlpD [Paraglaciecola sp.]|jgi:murein DD-endopeptidase MepM/ murein hydrolase activator NlpD
MKTFQILLMLLTLSCGIEQKESKSTTKAKSVSQKIELSYTDSLRQFFQKNPTYIADGFDFPVNPPDAKKYYNAQPFGKNSHLGDDWNGTGGGNTDLGDSVFSIGNGIVVAAENYGDGWGNAVRVVHFLGNHPKYQFVESVYAHLEEIKIQDGTLIKKGELLGTIGNANGQYWAHLHLEIRSDIELSIGGGYSENTTGYLNPTTFIKANRK